MTVIASGEIDFKLSPAALSRLENDITSAAKKGAAGAGNAAGNTFGKSFAGALTGVAAFSAIRTGFRFLADSVGEFTEAAADMAKTEAVLASTGGAAGVTAAHIDKLTKQLGELAAVDDDVVHNGTNVLLTFTKVRNQVGEGNDVFDQATGLALDMSEALGTDLQGSIIQVGKALNDPIKGITALQRVGVSFTTQQREQIKTLVESGRSLEAQKVILGELRTEFGGVAEAVGDSLAGRVRRAGVAFGELKESIGAGLAPALERTVPLVAGMASAIGDLPPGVIQASIAFGGLLASAAIFTRIKTLIDNTVTSLGNLGGAGRIAGTALAGLGALGGIAVGIEAAGQAVDFLNDRLSEAQHGKTDVDEITTALLDLAEGVGSLDDLLKSAGDSSISILDRIGAGAEGVVKGLSPFGEGGSVADALDTLDILSERFENVDQALAGLVSSGRAEAAATGFRALVDSMNLSDVDADTVFDDYAAAVLRASNASRDGQPAVGELGTGIAEVGDEAEDSATKIKTLDQKIRDLSQGIEDSALGQFLSFEDANIRLRDSIAKLNEQIAENGPTFDLATDAGRRNKEQLDNVIETAGKYVEGLVRTGQIAQTNEAFNANFVAQLQNIAKQFPSLRGEIDKYIVKLGQTPTTLKLEGDASGALGAIDQVNRTQISPKTVFITPQFGPGPAIPGQLLSDAERKKLFGRAGGGDVWPGSWIVGEHGRELLTIFPNGRGHVTNNDATERILNDNRGSGNTFTIIDNTGDPGATAERVAVRLGQDSKR